MDVLGNWLTLFATNFLDSLLSLLLSVFVQITSVSTALLNSTIVQHAVTYSQGLATVLLALKLLSDMYKTYLANVSGEQADMHPSQYIIRGIVALLFIWSIPFIVGEMITIGNKITSDVSAFSGAVPAKSFMEAMKAMAQNTMNTAMVGAEYLSLWLVIFCLFVAICLIIIVFQMAKRSVEVAVMAIIGPVFSINLASQDQSLYKNWFKHLMIVCVSQAIQILMLRLTFYAVTHQADLLGNASSNPLALLMIIALLIFTIKAPKFLEQFAYSSGGGGAVAGSISHFATTALNMLGRGGK